MHILLTHVTVDQWNTRWTSRMATIYIEQDRPFKQGDIVGDFVWRREHDAPIPAKVVKAWFCGVTGCNPEDIKVSYSRYAGCTTCPCSPGYKVMHTSRTFGGTRQEASKRIYFADLVDTIGPYQSLFVRRD